MSQNSNSKNTQTTQNSSNSSTADALATILTTVVLKYLKLDNLFYGSLFIIISSFIRDQNQSQSSWLWFSQLINIVSDFMSKIIGPMLYATIFIAVVIGTIYFIKAKKFDIYFYRKWETLKISERNKLIPLKEYLTAHVILHTNTPHYRINLPESLAFCAYRYSSNTIDTIKPEYNLKIYFEDKKYNIYGYFIWTNQKYSIPKYSQAGTTVPPVAFTETKHIDSLELGILKNNRISITQYYEYILDEYRTHLKKLNNQQLFFVKYFYNDSSKHCSTPSNIYYKIYDDKIDKSMDFNIFFNTFFHNEKKYLMKLADDMRDINRHVFFGFGQIPKLGLILHGPPGTGKSNFAYRLARHLNRHIVTLDLAAFTKEHIYNILSCPVFGDYGKLGPSDVIYLLDEFDETVMELKNRCDIKKKYIEYVTTNSLAFTIDKNSETTEGEPKTKKNKSTETNSENTVLKTLKEEVKSFDNLLTINQALEIFQGSVPLDGAIFIATTNKFTEINNIFPQLFRHGRLTPIYFGNFNGKTIKEVHQYYFGKPLSFPLDDNDEPNITNSKLLEWIQHYYKLPNGPDLFKNDFLNFVKKKINA